MMTYNTPPDTAVNLDQVGSGHPTGGTSVWTVEGVNSNPLDDDDDDDDDDGDDDGEKGEDDHDDDHVNLLEREFSDFYEDGVHKSAGPVVFVSKTLGMLPVIWTEDESESECKSYFNLYTFVVFIGGC